MVARRHQCGEFHPRFHLPAKHRKTVHQPHAMLRCQRANLCGVLHERLGRIGQRRGLLGRRCEQQHRDFCRLCLRDHRRPRPSRPLQSVAPVVESVVNRDDIGPVRQHLLREACRALRGRLAADGGHDHVDHRMREALCQSHVQKVRIGFMRANLRCHEVARRHAVPVADDIQGPVLRPVHPCQPGKLSQVGLGVGMHRNIHVRQPKFPAPKITAKPIAKPQPSDLKHPPPGKITTSYHLPTPRHAVLPPFPASPSAKRPVPIPVPVPIRV